jgi:hypothetical protein
MTTETTQAHPPEAALQELADGSCAPQAQPALRAHVAACASCQRTFAEYLDLFAGLEHFPQPAVPPRFAAEVMARVDAHVAARARDQRVAAVTLLGSLGLAAACFVLAGTGSWAEPVTRWSGLLAEFTRLTGVVTALVGPDAGPARVLLAGALAAVSMPLLGLLYRALQLPAEDTLESPLALS